MAYIDPICLGYSLSSCGTVGFHLNITYHNQVLFEEVVKDARDFKRCQTPQPGDPCFSCLKFGSILLKPRYARFCPQLLVTCTVMGREVRHTQDLQCVELGSDCTSTNCSGCAATAGCGWCGARATCLSSVKNIPYCDSCTANWYPTDTCPRPGIEGALTRPGPIVAGVLVPIFVIALIVGLCCYLKKRKRGIVHPKPSGGTVVPIELQETDDEGESYLDSQPQHKEAHTENVADAVPVVATDYL